MPRGGEWAGERGGQDGENRAVVLVDAGREARMGQCLVVAREDRGRARPPVRCGGGVYVLTTVTSLAREPNDCTDSSPLHNAPS